MVFFRGEHLRVETCWSTILVINQLNAQIMFYNKFIILEVCHPRCVCEDWKGYVVKHNCVSFNDYNILDNYIYIVGP